MTLPVLTAILRTRDRGSSRLWSDCGAAFPFEFDVTRLIYHFHYHLVAVGDKVESLEGLRTMRKYRDWRVDPFERGLPKCPRIQVKRGPFTNEPMSYTYLLKSYVQHRPTKAQPNGTMERSKRSFAIPDPHHALWLLWMDRWSIGAFVLLSGMKVTKAGFQITSLTQA